MGEMIELHCRCCQRSVEFLRTAFPDVPTWVARIEHDKCNLCDDGDRSEEHWVAADGSTPDPDMMPTRDDERPCTGCEGTGVTIQTERRCACQPPLESTDRPPHMIALVDMVETVKGDFHTEPGDPFWRVEIGGYCADFEYSEAANNFANAVNEAVLEAMRDAMINGYVEGAYQVHTRWTEDTDPDFGEAASDYAASILA